MIKQVPENPEKNRKSTETLTVITGLLVALYLISNMMAVRVIRIGNLSLFDAGTITFPFTYMLGDALTEIWGFQTARKTIVLTFICNLLLVAFTALGCLLPYPEYQEEMVQAYNMIFGFVPRIMFASMASFLCGELANAWVLIKIREKTGKKYLWIRTILSSVVGHGLDTGLFVVLAFGGVSPMGELVSMIAVQYVVKLLVEAIAGTPMVYGLVHWIQRRK